VKLASPKTKYNELLCKWKETPVDFYQTYKNVMKIDLMAMFRGFQEGQLPLFHLNFGTIVLVPKKENAA
jgi:hypothetical protein